GETDLLLPVGLARGRILQLDSFFLRCARNRGHARAQTLALVLEETTQGRALLGAEVIHTPKMPNACGRCKSGAHWLPGARSVRRRRDPHTLAPEQPSDAVEHDAAQAVALAH